MINADVDGEWHSLTDLAGGLLQKAAAERIL